MKKDVLFVGDCRPKMVFVCPYNPEFTFHSFSAFADCRGCSCGPYSDLEFGCRLAQLYVHTAYLNNLHRVTKEENAK